MNMLSNDLNEYLIIYLIKVKWGYIFILLVFTSNIYLEFKESKVLNFSLEIVKSSIRFLNMKPDKYESKNESIN
jgi:hypothetical protein